MVLYCSHDHKLRDQLTSDLVFAQVDKLANVPATASFNAFG